MSDSDPRSLSPDRRELLDALEKITLLPRPINEDDFAPLADHAIDLIEKRGQAIRGDKGISPETLLKYEAGLRRDGHGVAADGVAIMLMVYAEGVHRRGQQN
jgi:hypothetical protein